jgi:hypothetical protein
MFTKKPIINTVELKHECDFMYENFVVCTQQETHLFLGKIGEQLHVLKFNSSKIMYGGPNDEVRSSHNLAKFGDLSYGLYEVKNSPWISEQIRANRVHPLHSDSLFDGKKHFVACFKDVMFEITCTNWEEVLLTPEMSIQIVKREMRQLER